MMSDSTDISMEILDQTTELSAIKDAEEDKILETSKSQEELVETVSSTSEIVNEFPTDTVSEIPTEEILENKSKQSSRLPLSRIKQIMKFDSDCSLISRDALFLVSKATELFLEFLGEEAVKHTLNNKKKTVSKKDVEAAIDCVPHLCFLDGALDWE